MWLLYFNGRFNEGSWKKETKEVAKKRKTGQNGLGGAFSLEEKDYSLVRDNKNTRIKFNVFYDFSKFIKY